MLRDREYPEYTFDDHWRLFKMLVWQWIRDLIG